MATSNRSNYSGSTAGRARVTVTHRNHDGTTHVVASYFSRWSNPINALTTARAAYGDEYEYTSRFVSYPVIERYERLRARARTQR